MRRGVLRWTWLLALPMALVACGSAPGSSPEQPPQSTPIGPESSPNQSTGTEETPSNLTSAEQAAQIWEQMSPRQQVASVLMLNYPGTDGAAIAQFVAEIEPAGLIFMGDGIPEDEGSIPETMSQIQSMSAVPILIAVDQEGGLVRRVTTDPTPGAQELRTQDAAATEAAFSTRADRLKELGFNTNFGIVADWTDDPDSFIYSRVLGTDAASSSERVAAAVAGEKGTVLSSLKHFPGHGSVAADSHTSIPSTDMAQATWLGSEAPPFIAGIDAGAEMVMLGHLAYTDVDTQPASLSPIWVGLLRGDLGFDGIIVTDDMKMLRDNGIPEFADAGQNAVAALKAGVDLVLDIGQGDVAPIDFANGLIDTIVAALETGELPGETLKDAGTRVLTQRLDLGAELGGASGG